MNAVINESNLNIANEKGKNGSEDFNCWGATLFVLDKRKILKWISLKIITKFITHETFEITTPQLGDILVLYKNDKIIHTAIYIKKDLLFHKRGANISEFTTEKNIKHIYWDYDYCTINRIKRV
jgi:hypothetical protein